MNPLAWAAQKVGSWWGSGSSSSSDNKYPEQPQLIPMRTENKGQKRRIEEVSQSASDKQADANDSGIKLASDLPGYAAVGDKRVEVPQMRQSCDFLYETKSHLLPDLSSHQVGILYDKDTLKKFKIAHYISQRAFPQVFHVQRFAANDQKIVTPTDFNQFFANVVRFYMNASEQRLSPHFVDAMSCLQRGNMSGYIITEQPSFDLVDMVIRLPREKIAELMQTIEQTVYNLKGKAVMKNLHEVHGFLCHPSFIRFYEQNQIEHPQILGWGFGATNQASLSDEKALELTKRVMEHLTTTLPSLVPFEAFHGALREQPFWLIYTKSILMSRWEQCQQVMFSQYNQWQYMQRFIQNAYGIVQHHESAALDVRSTIDIFHRLVLDTATVCTWQIKQCVKSKNQPNDDQKDTITPYQNHHLVAMNAEDVYYGDLLQSSWDKNTDIFEAGFMMPAQLWMQWRNRLHETKAVFEYSPWTTNNYWSLLYQSSWSIWLALKWKLFDQSLVLLNSMNSIPNPSQQQRQQFYQLFNSQTYWNYEVAEIRAMRLMNHNLEPITNFYDLKLTPIIFSWKYLPVYAADPKRLPFWKHILQKSIRKYVEDHRMLLLRYLSNDQVHYWNQRIQQDLISKLQGVNITNNQQLMEVLSGRESFLMLFQYHFRKPLTYQLLQPNIFLNNVFIQELYYCITNEELTDVLFAQYVGQYLSYPDVKSYDVNTITHAPILNFCFPLPDLRWILTYYSDKNTAVYVEAFQTWLSNIYHQDRKNIETFINIKNDPNFSICNVAQLNQFLKPRQHELTLNWLVDDQLQHDMLNWISRVCAERQAANAQNEELYPI